MFLQRVLPDGACVFRAVSTAFIYQLTGTNIGPGTPDAYETSFKDIVANVASKWLRRLTVLSLCSTQGNSIDLETFLPVGTDTEMSFLEVLGRADQLLQQNGINYTGTAAQRMNLKRTLQPPSQFIGRCAPRRKMPCGMLAESLVETGPRQTFRQYCTKLSSDFTWGGEAELYVLSTCVLKMPIVVLDSEGVVIQRYSPNIQSAHVVRVQFNGKNHYDAVLHLPDDVPPLFRL